MGRAFIYRTEYVNGHIAVTLCNRHDRSKVIGGPYCGDNWCSGCCGLPALTLNPENDRKLSGNQVAVGAVWQPFHTKSLWKGKIDHLQNVINMTSEDLESCIKAMWL